MGLMYYLRNGFKINKVLGDLTNDTKKNYFSELNAKLLLKGRMYCYGNTCYTCCGTDGCHCCTLIDFNRAELRSRKNCLIAQKYTQICVCEDCLKETELHPILNLD